MIWEMYIDRLAAEPAFRDTYSSAPASAANGALAAARGPPDASGDPRDAPVAPPAAAAAAAALVALPPAATEANAATDLRTPDEAATRAPAAARNRFSDYVVDWLDRNYGARQLAAAQLTSMVASLRRSLVSIDDARLRMFARLCDASDQPPLAPDGAAFFLRALHLTLSLRAGSTAHFPKETTVLVSLERALAVVHELFGGVVVGGAGAAAAAEEARPEAEERLRAALVAMSGGESRASIDVDELLLMTLAEHEETKRPPRVRPSLLRLFAASDVNHDGTLDLDEWLHLAEHLRLPKEAALPLFHQMGRIHPPAAVAVAAGGAPAGGCGITAAAFLETCAVMDLTAPPPAEGGLEPESVAALAEIDREWLKLQGRLAGQLRQLHAHVRASGGMGPAEYPSAKLLARGTSLLAAATARIGALSRGEAAERAQAAAAEVRAELDAACQVFERGAIAIELEAAQHASWTAFIDDSDDGDDGKETPPPPNPSFAAI